MCADKQSTDWFHSISRTLKWNERERQKSFVVVEEGPAKPKKRKQHGTAIPEKPKAVSPEPVEESFDDEEEDEVSDEEEDTFDIDDSSPEAESKKTATLVNTQTIHDVKIGQEKALENVLEHQVHQSVTTSTLRRDGRRTKSRSRSRASARSGVETPDRFAGGRKPHPRSVSPRHVEFNMQTPSPTESNQSNDAEAIDSAHRGARDDLHAHRPSSAKSRIPRDRDIDLDSAKTPTASNLIHGRQRNHSRGQSGESHPRRAFAVWGHDESDSNASDSDV